MKVIVNDGGVLDDGKAIHEPGDKVELKGAEAKRLIKSGRVRPIGLNLKNPLHVVVDQAEIVKGIGTLPIDDQTLWTKSGAPTTEALTAAIGKDVTAKDRDAAWVIYQQGRQQ